MPKNNHAIPNTHFHKAWQERVRVNFSQPQQKLRRRQKRAEKAAQIFPRPVAGPLRPLVRCPTIRYNQKVRLGRGFTLDELKAAGINKRLALSIGIAVDHRRSNRSEESFQENVQRLKKYKANLILFPRNPKAKKPVAGDATAQEVSQASQLKSRVLEPYVPPTVEIKGRAITEADSKVNAFVTLRRARADARLVGVRAKRAKEGDKKKPGAKGAPAKGAAPAKGGAAKGGAAPAKGKGK